MPSLYDNSTVIPRIPIWVASRKKTYQKLSRSSFANIMSSRAAGATLEIVRVLCMHMGDDIIFFIANAWPSPPYTHTPCRAT